MYIHNLKDFDLPGVGPARTRILRHNDSSNNDNSINHNNNNNNNM